MVIGVSTQDEASHQGFAQKEGLRFSLLPDPKREIAKAYGVDSTLGFDHRVTFLIDGQGVVRKVWPEVSPGRHAHELLEAIQALAPQSH